MKRQSAFVSIVLIAMALSLFHFSNSALAPAQITSTVSGAAGANTQVQYNNNGALGANAQWTWNGSNAMTIGAGTFPSIQFGQGNGSGGTTFQFGATGPTLTSDGTNVFTRGSVIAREIASGTSTLSSTTVTGGTCATVVTTTASGALTTDSIIWSYASAPATADGLMTVAAYTTSGNVNFLRCAPSGNQTGTAIVINWIVAR